MTTDHTPPAEQTALRDRIAEAMRTAPSFDVRPDWTAPGGPLRITARINDLADAVLAVLPPPVSRAEVYRDAAQRLRERAEACKSGAFRTAFRAAADGLDCDADATDPSRMADEAQPAERRCTCSHPADEHSVYGCEDDCGCEWMPKRRKRSPMSPWRILGIADCPTPLTHNWGCGCPGDQLPLHAESGVDTPGCDCGHDGMGPKWHLKTCAWVATLTVPHLADVADEAQPGTEAQS